MVFQLAAVRRARYTQARQIRTQSGKRFFHHGTAQIDRGVRIDQRRAGADEERIEFFGHGIGIEYGRGCREFFPGGCCRIVCRRRGRRGGGRGRGRRRGGGRGGRRV